jgi:DNA-binding LytR/AlgR family response regulator
LRPARSATRVGQGIAVRIAALRYKYTAAVTPHSEHLVSRPLKHLVEELDPEVFRRVHRSYVVNLRAILAVRKEAGGLEIVLRDHRERIPVSQPYAHRSRQM